MRWLADENIPNYAIAYLRQRGEDVGLISLGDAVLDGRFTVIAPEGLRQRPLHAAS